MANPEVGKYLNEYFVSSYQKVATFKIVGKQKQGGNVAAYFCATDGRVLHVVAGPVDAKTLLKEAQWVVETTKKGLKEAKNDGSSFKAFFRKAHAERLRTELRCSFSRASRRSGTRAPRSPLQACAPRGRRAGPR